MSHCGRRSESCGKQVLWCCATTLIVTAVVVAGSQSADCRNVQASPAIGIAIGRERYQPKQKFLQS
jgi:hypothetical protein